MVLVQIAGQPDEMGQICGKVNRVLSCSTADFQHAGGAGESPDQNIQYRILVVFASLRKWFVPHSSRLSTVAGSNYTAGAVLPFLNDDGMFMYPAIKRMGQITRALLILAITVLCSVSSAQDDTSRTDFDERLKRWNFQITQAETQLLKQGASDAVLESVRNDVQNIQQETADVVKRASAQAGEVRGLLEALGPPPKEDEPPEEPSVAERRSELQDRLAMFEGQVKQAEVTAERARQLLEHQQARQRERLAEELLSSGPSPLSWSVLSSAGPQFVSALGQLYRAPPEAWAPSISTDAGEGTVPKLLLAALAALLIAWPVRAHLLKRYVRNREVHEPLYRQKVVAAVMVGVSRGLLPALLAAAPLAILLSRGRNLGIIGDVLVGALIGVIAVVFCSGLARAALAPASPSGWRLTPLTDKSAKALYRRIRQVLIIAATLFFIEYPASRHVHINDELRILYNFIGDSVLAIFMLALLPKRLWKTVDREEPGSTEGTSRSALKIQILRASVAIAAISIPIASVFGYQSLATYLTDNLLITGVVVGVFVVFHGLAREVLTLMLERTDHEDEVERERAEVDGSARMLRFWLISTFDFALLLLGALVLLWAWGIGVADFREWLRALMSGIKIGTFTLSINDVVIAILVFAAVLFATRTFQRFLEHHLFPQTRLDIGIRHSLKTATGYLGLVIAAALAISALGLDLSNLAIIAGALSVGIGFGLQNIVNNFVSGLILLVERPVKVGDWVVVGANEGYVKRINVRATELETFQRSSVIIPNSELLSSAVINWTHKDTNARVDIPVGVAYGSDIELVRDTLIECARRHPSCSEHPEPFVLFQNFGESSLDFGLRFYVAHADQSFRAASDVRFAIVKAFEEKGVQIPFPQRDLHLHTVDGDKFARTPKRDDQESGENNQD